MDAQTIILLILLLAGIFMLVAVGRKAFKRKGFLNTVFLVLGIALVAYGGLGFGSQLGWYTLPSGVNQLFLTTGVAPGILDSGGVVVTPGQPSFQPTASYTAKDKYSTTTITGTTSYYKVGSNVATTTAQTNVNKGDQVVYWVDNASYWINPQTKTIVEGVNNFEVLGYNNGTATLSLYDQVGRASTTGGSNNISLGANAQGNVEISYQGTAEKSAGPFGGVMIFEYNSTISSVTCTGDVLLDSNPYHLTYTTAKTTHVYKPFAYGPSIDDGSGSVKRIDCQVKNGASAVGGAGAVDASTTPTNGAYYRVTFIPANYYVSNAGDILLDTEKFASSSTTRTGSTINQPIVVGYWNA